MNVRTVNVKELDHSNPAVETRTRVEQRTTVPPEKTSEKTPEQRTTVFLRKRLQTSVSGSHDVGGPVSAEVGILP